MIFLFFLSLFLKHKEETEYNGVETYVANALKDMDATWVPNQTAMCLSEEMDSSDQGKDELVDEMIQIAIQIHVMFDLFKFVFFFKREREKRSLWI